MRVLALVPNLLGSTPGQRSSIEAWEPTLLRAGIEISYSTFETPALHEVLYQTGNYVSKISRMLKAYAGQARSALRQVSDYDAVFVYREAALIGPAILERMAVRRGKPLIYQLDDPLYLPYRSPFSGAFSYLKFFGKVEKICRIASAVTVNSTPINEYVSQFNDNVWQIPSVIDTDRYTYVPKIPSGSVCVGWTGSPSTAPNLGMIARPLRELQQRAPHRLHLIGSSTFELPGLDFTSQTWSADTEVEDLRQLDVGLVPLPENEWNKRKFLMKIAQYMALGIPPVSTPMGSAPFDIEHGVNGFLAATDEEWVRYLEILVRDDELRIDMSGHAAATARTRFSLEANEAKIVGAFRSVME